MSEPDSVLTEGHEQRFMSALVERRDACSHNEVRAIVRHFPTGGHSAHVWLYCVHCGLGTWAA